MVPPEQVVAPAPSQERQSQKKQDPQLHHPLWQVTGVDLTTIDGISTGLARTILTEIGPQRAAFPPQTDFVSWLRFCPRMAISGGKSREFPIYLACKFRLWFSLLIADGCRLPSSFPNGGQVEMEFIRAN